MEVARHHINIIQLPRYMKRERDDVAAKDILSQLSKDDTLLEEIRKIALRGIIRAQRGSRDDVPAQENGGENSKNEKMDKNYKRILTSSSSTTTDENDIEKELAFTISRNSETYRRIFSTASWYRDALLVGSTTTDFDQINTIQKNVCDSEINNIKITADISTKVNNISKYHDPSTAMAHPFLLSAVENYLRSNTAVDFLRPYATWAVSSEGPMFPLSTQSLAQSIPLAQTICDNAIRENLRWVLKDEGWREWAKSIAANYVDRSYKGGE